MCSKSFLVLMINWRFSNDCMLVLSSFDVDLFDRWYMESVVNIGWFVLFVN
jgi:hypothetical protein